jgi:hypothetical protein
MKCDGRGLPRRLTGKRRGFKDFLMGEGPSLEGLDLARDSAPMRAVEL